MKKTHVKLTTKFIVTVIAILLIISMVSCTATTPKEEVTAKKSDTVTAKPAEPTEAIPKYDKKLTVEIYAALANYQGIMSGWFANIVLDKFNMEFNILAPNVAGGGETLFLTRSAAGNLGDMINLSQEDLADTVKAGLLMDITDLMYSNCTNYTDNYPNAIKKIQDYLDTDKIYAIPTDVNTQSPLSPSSIGDPDTGSFMRWDYYTGIGSPVINSMDDLLDILKQMQEKYPMSESEKQTYGFSFFKDWDGGVMQNSALFAFMYGYGFQNSCFYYGDCSETIIEPIIDDNGIYLKTLKMYYDANQMGLVDPDSSAQNWDTLSAKFADGQVLFSWWPWLGGSQFNTDERAAQGIGFAFVPIMDSKAFSNGYKPSGGPYNMVIALGSQAQDPERLINFFDWMCSVESLEYVNAGPRGLTWEIVDGKPVMTDYGKKVQVENLEVPEEFGGGNYIDGMLQFNFSFVDGCEINPNTNEPYRISLWESTIAASKNNLDIAWQEAMEAVDAMDYLNQHDMLVVAPGSDYAPPADTSDIETKRAQCGPAIINASWQMIFAEDEEEFNKIWDEMKTEVIGFGYNDVLAWDTQIVEELNAARRKSLSEAE